MKHKIQISTLVFTIFAGFLGFRLVIAIFSPVILHDHMHLLPVDMAIFSRNGLLGF